MDAKTVNQPSTRISILIPCEIDDTKKLMDALNHVAQKLRVSTTIRGYAGAGCAWTVSDAKQPNDQAHRCRNRNAMNSPKTQSRHSVQRMIRRMACKCGWHEWVSDSECIESTTDKRTLVILWWNCKHCWETKLKCLLR